MTARMIKIERNNNMGLRVMQNHGFAYLQTDKQRIAVIVGREK